jgi:hypothetical protein
MEDIDRIYPIEQPTKNVVNELITNFLGQAFDISKSTRDTDTIESMFEKMNEHLAAAGGADEDDPDDGEAGEEPATATKK